jgi:hypothetical protein
MLYYKEKPYRKYSADNKKDVYRNIDSFNKVGKKNAEQ